VHHRPYCLLGRRAHRPAFLAGAGSGETHMRARAPYVIAKTHESRGEEMKAFPRKSGDSGRLNERRNDTRLARCASLPVACRFREGSERNSASACS
jgi:hypothetical protein